MPENSQCIREHIQYTCKHKTCFGIFATLRLSAISKKCDRSWDTDIAVFECLFRSEVIPESWRNVLPTNCVRWSALCLRPLRIVFAKGAGMPQLFVWSVSLHPSAYADTCFSSGLDGTYKRGTTECDYLNSWRHTKWGDVITTYLADRFAQNHYFGRQMSDNIPLHQDIVLLIGNILVYCLTSTVLKMMK